MRELGWYKYFVYPGSVLGSLFTLVHMPFMLAFMSLVIIGTITLTTVNVNLLILSLLIVFLLLYAEHMMDDTTSVGKPWKTVFSDNFLIISCIILFFISGLIAVKTDMIYHLMGAAQPMYVIGVMFCIMYGAEIAGFHRTWFGALGMGAIPIASYAAQVFASNSSINYITTAALGLFGFAYGYVMLELYEYTKTQNYKIAWKLLGVHFIMIYSIAVILLVLL